MQNTATSYKLNQLKRRSRRIRIAISIAFILIFSVFTFLFISMYPGNQGERFAFQFANEQYDVQNPQRFKLSTRQKTEYYSVIGTVKDKGKVLAIFDHNGDQHKIIKTSSLISNKKISEIIEKYKPQKISEITPSIYKKTAVYEVIFYTKNNQMDFLTVDIKTGEIYRQIEGL